jgi:bifunctional DNase/RNase
MSRCTLIRTAVATLAALLGIGCGAQDAESGREVRVHVDRVAMDHRDIPVLVLEEDEGSRWLPIWIGTFEARSIALEMENRSSPRPNTHDLARNVIYGLDGDVERVVVTELKAGTYYAKLGLRMRNRSIEIDSRPSDAIAIALRTGAPIYVRENLFEAAASPPDSDEETPIAGESGREI